MQGRGVHVEGACEEGCRLLLPPFSRGSLGLLPHPGANPLLNSRWRSAAFYRTAVCGLAKTAASKKSLAGKPGGVFRGQKDSDGGDITWLADAAERRLREGELFELRSDEAAAVGAFSLDYSGTEGVDPDLFRAELAGQHDRDGVDRGLGAGVNRAVRRCDATGNGADVDDAGAFAEVLDGCLRGFVFGARNR
jgi:hypothetical protein